MPEIQQSSNGVPSPATNHTPVNPAPAHNETETREGIRTLKKDISTASTQQRRGGEREEKVEIELVIPDSKTASALNEEIAHKPIPKPVGIKEQQVPGNETNTAANNPAKNTRTVPRHRRPAPIEKNVEAAPRQRKNKQHQQQSTGAKDADNSAQIQTTGIHTAPATTEIKKGAPSSIEEINEAIKQNKRRILELETQEKSLVETSKKLKEKLTAAEAALAPIIEEEKEVEARIAEVEEKEHETSEPESRREYEKARWAFEEKRRAIEEQKWEKEKVVGDIRMEVAKQNGAADNIRLQMRQLRDTIAVLEKRKKIIEVSEQLNAISQEKERLETRWVNLNDKQQELSEKLKPIEEDEAAAEKEKAAIEEKEHTEKDYAKQREIEQKRWEIEDKLKEIEKRRWEIEDKLKEIEQDIETLRPQYQSALSKEKELKETLATLQAQV